MIKLNYLPSLLLSIHICLHSSTHLVFISEVILDKKLGRENEKDITVYKSLGNTAQDLAAAYAALTTAQQQGKTSTIEFSSP